MVSIREFLFHLNEQYPQEKGYVETIVRILEHNGVPDVCHLEGVKSEDLVDDLGAALGAGEKAFIRWASTRARQSSWSLVRERRESIYRWSMDAAKDVIGGMRPDQYMASVYVCQYLTSWADNWWELGCCRKGMIHLRVLTSRWSAEERDVKWWSSSRDYTNYHGRWEWNSKDGRLDIWFNCHGDVEQLKRTRLSCFVEASPGAHRLYMGKDHGQHDVVLNPRERFVVTKGEKEPAWSCQKDPDLQENLRVDTDWVVPEAGAGVAGAYWEGG